MSPEYAKIFLAEDDKIEVVNTRWFLKEKGGHEVVLEAKSLEEALDMVPKLLEKGVNIAVVDGNLSPEKHDGEDGAKVAEAIRKQAPGVKIIAYSGGNYDYGDVYVSKPLGPGERLVKIEEIATKL